MFEVQGTKKLQSLDSLKENDNMVIGQDGECCVIILIALFSDGVIVIVKFKEGVDEYLFLIKRLLKQILNLTPGLGKIF